MKIHKWDELKRQRTTPERLEEIETLVQDEVLAMNLAAVREMAGKTQAEVAELMGASQSEISRSERRSDHLVSTLQEYVRALGGELEITARFGEKSVRLRGV